MKRSKILLIACSAILAVAMYGCYYDNEETLYPKNNLPGSTTTCDTANVTYSKTIAPMIANYCAGCHGASNQSTGGGVKLDTYSDLKPMISSVITSVSRASNPMPKGMAKLSDCSINQLTIWKNAGAPNN